MTVVHLSVVGGPSNSNKIKPLSQKEKNKLQEEQVKNESTHSDIAIIPS